MKPTGDPSPREAAQYIKILERFIELQDKLLMCYRVGKQPGKWLDEMSGLREKIQDSKGESTP